MEKESTLKDRFSALLDHYNISVKELTEKIGGSKATYFNIKNGSSQPDFKTFTAILEGFPDLSAEWFTRGEGPMLKSEIISKEEAEAIIAENKAIKAMYRAELLGKDKGANFCPDTKKVLRIEGAKQAIQNARRVGRRGTSKQVSVRVPGALIVPDLKELFSRPL